MTEKNQKRVPPRTKRVEFQAKWTFFLILFIVELFIYTWIQVEHTGMRSTISQARKTQKEKRAYQAALMVEKERLSSPKRITTIARDNLNLHTPTPRQQIQMGAMP